MGMLANRLDKSYRIQWFHHTRSFPGVTQLGIFLRETLFRFLKFFVKRFSLRSKLICSKNLSQNDLVHSHHTISHFLRSPKTVSLTASLSLMTDAFQTTDGVSQISIARWTVETGKDIFTSLRNYSLPLSLSLFHTHTPRHRCSLSLLSRCIRKFLFGLPSRQVFISSVSIKPHNEKQLIWRTICCSQYFLNKIFFRKEKLS